MRKTIAWTVVTTVILVAATIGSLLYARGTRRLINGLLVTPEPPRQGDPFGLRHVMLAERSRALAAGDVAAAARINATLSHEALLRAAAVHKAWLGRRQPQTKLYAQSAQRPEWNYRNTAADFFAFHLNAGLLLNPAAAMPSLTETLAAEAALRTEHGLCQPVIAATGRPVQVDHDELLFGSSEYAKDGLLNVYERHGGELIGPRLLAIVDAVIAQSRHPSRFGVLPGTGSEINGNMLQLCGRLSYAEGRPQYAAFAARIADATIEQAMAANNGLPPKFYDFANDKVLDPTLKLKDHGNEIVLGLAEAYAMAVDHASRGDAAWRERAARWEAPLARMFAVVLEHGVNADGLLVGTMHPSPPRPDPEKLCDNWGYILSGAVLFADAARRRGELPPPQVEAIEAGVDRIARAVFAKPVGLAWSGGMDSEADAVESAIYVAAYRPPLRAEALRWVDRQIAMLFEHQDADGTAVGEYLDGNFIRTSLLYADTRTAGWRVEPWRDDVQVGFASGANGDAVLTVWSTHAYSGELLPPQPRHRSIMKLPWNWARLNSWPEWFADGEREVVRATGIELPTGQRTLGAAIPLNLGEHGSATVHFARPKASDVVGATVVSPSGDATGNPR